MTLNFLEGHSGSLGAVPVRDCSSAGALLAPVAQPVLEVLQGKGLGVVQQPERGCVSNWTKNYGKVVNRRNQPSTSDAGSAVGTKRVAWSGSSLYLLLNGSVTWLMVLKSGKKGLTGTLITVMGFGYPVLVGQQRRRGRK